MELAVNIVRWCQEEAGEFIGNLRLETVEANRLFDGVRVAVAVRRREADEIDEVAIPVQRTFAGHGELGFGTRRGYDGLLLGTVCVGVERNDFPAEGRRCQGTVFFVLSRADELHRITLVEQSTEGRAFNLRLRCKVADDHGDRLRRAGGTERTGYGERYLVNAVFGVRMADFFTDAGVAVAEVPLVLDNAFT